MCSSISLERDVKSGEKGFSIPDASIPTAIKSQRNSESAALVTLTKVYYRVSTYFYELASQESAVPPTLHVKLAKRHPERELKFHCHVAQLTGVLLDDMLKSRFRTVTTVPLCDQPEVQAAQRNLYR